MELSLSSEDAAFRDEVRAFIAEKCRLTRSGQIECSLLSSSTVWTTRCAPGRHQSLRLMISPADADRP